MEKTRKINVNTKTIIRSLKRRTRANYVLCKTNSALFKIGSFIQKINYKKSEDIDKLYYDFKRANLLNEEFLLFIKEYLRLCRKENLTEIMNMLAASEESNVDIMKLYDECFQDVMKDNGYKSYLIAPKLIKTLKKNKYFLNYLK